MGISMVELWTACQQAEDLQAGQIFWEDSFRSLQHMAKRLPFIMWITFGQLLNLSEPQFIDLLDKDNDIYFDEDES